MLLKICRVSKQILTDITRFKFILKIPKAVISLDSKTIIWFINNLTQYKI